MNCSLANIPMKNYLVAASSPLTESMERLNCCKEAGFAAAILKSCADYRRTGNGYGRKVVYIEDGYYADASFENEILTLEEGLQLYRSAQMEYSSEMLIIPSLSASSLDAAEWISICERFQSLGAKVLQLDFFYLGTLKHDAAFFESLSILLSALKQRLTCEIMPKLNLRFTPEIIFSVLKASGVTVVSLLDSMREVPAPEYHLHPDTTSYFGPRELPYTLHYLEQAKAAQLQVLAGGGIASKEDVSLLLEKGADMIQVASYVLTRDFTAVQDLLPKTNTAPASPLLRHNPWCDYPHPGDCDRCGACKGGHSCH